MDWVNLGVGVWGDLRGIWGFGRFGLELCNEISDPDPKKFQI